jgi:hypothetical protein
MLCLLNHRSRANAVPMTLGGNLWDRRTIRIEPRFPRRGHLPTQRQIRNFPTLNSRAVTTAPTSTSA